MGKHQAAIASGDIETTFSDIINGYHALNALVFLLNEGGLAPDAYETIQVRGGLSCLLENQVDRLEDIAEAVRLKDIALGEFRQQAAPKAPAPTANAVKIREEFIAAKASEGADLGDIAGAMNMKRVSIEKVIRRLQGETGGAVPHAVAG